MSAQPVKIERAAPAERLRALREEIAALLAATWAHAQVTADQFEDALNDLDQEGIPEGVRQMARRLASDNATALQSMAAIMEKRR